MLAAYLIATTVTATASTIYAHTARHRWAERGIHTGRIPVTVWAAAGIPLAVLLTLACLPAFTDLPGHVAVSAAAGLGGWATLTTLSIGTDLATTKVPRDACLFAILIGLTVAMSTVSVPFMVLSMVSVIAVAGVALLARMMVGGLGFSDIRILTAAGLLLGWWVPTPFLLYALIGASLTQIVLRLAAPEALLVRLAEKPADGDPAADTPVRKRPLPFAPALLVWLTGFVVYAGMSTSTSCGLWPAACG